MPNPRYARMQAASELLAQPNDEQNAAQQALKQAKIARRKKGCVPPTQTSVHLLTDCLTGTKPLAVHRLYSA